MPKVFSEHVNSEGVLVRVMVTTEEDLKREELRREALKLKYGNTAESSLNPTTSKVVGQEGTVVEPINF